MYKTKYLISAVSDFVAFVIEAFPERLGRVDDKMI